MNHLQNHIDNYLVHCQTQKRLDAKTLKAYRTNNDLYLSTQKLTFEFDNIFNVNVTELSVENTIKKIMECINQSITHGVLFIAYILNTSGLTFFMLIKNTPFRNIFLVAKSAFISAYWKFISSFFLSFT